jgi:cytochrome P450
MAVRDPASQRPLSQQQLQAELVTATLAGFETTSNALSWTLGSLAAHPHALAALEQVCVGATTGCVW